MTYSVDAGERYLISFNDGDRSFAVSITAQSFQEAHRAFSSMSREERRRHIISSMAPSEDVDVLESCANWFRRRFFTARSRR